MTGRVKAGLGAFVCFFAAGFMGSQGFRSLTSGGGIFEKSDITGAVCLVVAAALIVVATVLAFKR